MSRSDPRADEHQRAASVGESSRPRGSCDLAVEPFDHVVGADPTPALRSSRRAGSRGLKLMPSRRHWRLLSFWIPRPGDFLGFGLQRALSRDSMENTAFSASAAQSVPGLRPRASMLLEMHLAHRRCGHRGGKLPRRRPAAPRTDLCQVFTLLRPRARACFLMNPRQLSRPSFTPSATEQPARLIADTPGCLAFHGPAPAPFVPHVHEQVRVRNWGLALLCV